MEAEVAMGLIDEWLALTKKRESFTVDDVRDRLLDIRNWLVSATVVSPSDLEKQFDASKD